LFSGTVIENELSEGSTVSFQANWPGFGFSAGGVVL